MKLPTIEKNIPIPSKKEYKTINSIWRLFLKQLEIGDSFISYKAPNIMRGLGYDIGITLTSRPAKTTRYRYWRIK